MNLTKGFTIKSATASHIGMKRQENEDSYLVDECLKLWIVADGMGGHSNGKMASNLACKLIHQRVSQGEGVEQAVEFAHDNIQTLAESLDVKNGMGTTVVVAKINDEYLDIWWVGDSRAYLQKGQTLALLSHDHSRVQELLDQELISPIEALKHPQKHLITRSLGIATSAGLAVDHARYLLSSNTKILLCSDGLSNELSNDEILQTLQSELKLPGQVEKLVNLSNIKGGNDNITAILLNVGLPEQ